jgi:DNA modification methylase
MSKPKRQPAPDLSYIAEDLRPFAVPIDSLVLDPKNARLHNEPNIASIKASLAARGQRKPITVRRDGSIVMTGNGTVETAKALGWTHIAALFFDDDAAEAAAWAIADNRSAELATWDYRQLGETMAAFPEVDWLAVGHEANELEAILAHAAVVEIPSAPETTTVGEHERELPSDGPDEDEVPPPPSEPRTKFGEVIQLGRHTLHCLDCMDLLRSLPDNSIDAIVTDPPYGLSPDGRARTWDDLDDLRRMRHQCQDRCPTHVVGLPSVSDPNDPDSEPAKEPIAIRIILSQRSVQVRSIKLDDGRNGWEVEVTGDRPVGHVEDLLVSEWNAALRQALAKGDLAIRVRQGLSGCVRSCSCSAECSHPFGGILVGLSDDALGEPQGSAGVMAFRRTEMRAVLAFDVTGSSAQLFPARGANNVDPTLLLASAESVGAFTAASGLPSVPKSADFGDVRFSAHRALAFDAFAASAWTHRSIHDPSVTRRGFMNNTWDAGVPGITWARECLRVLKPGGHMIAHSATRTIHRLACAIEDAGFELRDQIGWLHWQGFPKSHNVSIAIDAAAGETREVTSRETSKWTKTGRGRTYGKLDGFETDGSGYEIREVTSPASDDAKRWDGWGTALKPAIEPAVFARKPLSEPTVAANVLRWGTGAINVDACRYALGDQAWPGPGGAVESMPYPKAGNKIYGELGYREGETWDGHDLGRFPANIYYCPKPAGAERELGTEHLPQAQLAGSIASDDPVSARFRSQPTGNAHPTVKPIKLYRWLLRLVTPPGGRVLEPFGGSGTTLVAACDLDCEVIASEREPKYADIIRARVEARLARAALP